MARIVAVKEYLEKALKDESKPWTKMFVLAEEKTGVDRLYIFVGEFSFTGRAIMNVGISSHFHWLEADIYTANI